MRLKKKMLTLGIYQTVIINEKSSQIRTGEWHLDSDDKTERDFNVKNIIVHKLFNRPQRFANDIALLELSEDADLNGS